MEVAWYESPSFGCDCELGELASLLILVRILVEYQWVLTMAFMIRSNINQRSAPSLGIWLSMLKRAFAVVQDSPWSMAVQSRAKNAVLVNDASSVKSEVSALEPSIYISIWQGVVRPRSYFQRMPPYLLVGLQCQTGVTFGSSVRFWPWSSEC